MTAPALASSVACPFDHQQLARAFAPLIHDAGILQIDEVFMGNINTIIKVTWNGHQYGLRIRTQETVYRYEPDLVKEAFVSWLLCNHHDDLSDTAIATTFAALRASQRGLSADHPPILPVVRYFDWSRQRLPHPYCIYDWIAGVPLWDTPASELYTRAGQLLTQIHKVRFSSFYTDFLTVGVQPVNWPERFSTALTKEVQAAGHRLSTALIAQLQLLQLPTENSAPPCLVHNDFAPGNILVRDGAIAAVIDWDNAVIDVPHLDFVKMKYWTTKDSQGELTHHPMLFAAFVDGYGPTGRKIVSSSLFKLYEVLWLLRVFNFERAKEEQGLSRAPGYPAAATYEQYLRSWIT